MLRKQHILRLCENRMLRRKCQDTGEECIMESFLTGMLHGYQISKNEMSPPFGRPRRGWEDNIKKDLREMG
jgi:hypothetical protein